ncbi:MAG: hypothetical protein AAF483_03180 [Planctomycetota bacterium]
MSIKLETVFIRYPKAKKLSGRTRKEYKSTLAKWLAWGTDIEVGSIERTHIREFIDWVHEKAVQDGGSNPGRAANKSRENLRAILSWAWEQDYIEKLPRFRKPKPQRDVAGRQYLTKPDLNACTSLPTDSNARVDGSSRSLWASTGEQRWSSSSTTVSTRVPCFGVPIFMSPYSGDIFLGALNLPTDKERNPATAGSTIAELRPARSFIVR